MKKIGSPLHRRMVAIGSLVALGVASGSVALVGLSDRGAPPGESAETLPPSSAPPITRPVVTAVIVGDSVALGAGAGSVENGFAARTCRMMNWSCEIDAIGGSGFFARGNRFKEDGLSDDTFGARMGKIITSDPDVILVAGGRNDMHFPSGDAETAIIDYFEDLRDAAPNAEIYTVAGFIWDTAGEQRWRDKQREVSAHLSRASSDVDAQFIDLRDSALINDANSAVMLSGDGFHPSSHGADALAKGLTAHLLELGAEPGPEVWVEEVPLSGRFVDRVDQILGDVVVGQAR